MMRTMDAFKTPFQGILVDWLSKHRRVGGVHGVCDLVVGDVLEVV